MKKMSVIKLNEDDILEILIEHYQTGKFSRSKGSAKLFGNPGQDLRALIVLSDDHNKNFDLDVMEKNTDFNGDHSFLKEHPEFDLSKHFKKEDRKK